MSFQPCSFASGGVAAAVFGGGAAPAYGYSDRRGVALAIDAKDGNAAMWYERFGAVRLLDDPLKLVLPLRVIADAIAAAQKTDR